MDGNNFIGDLYYGEGANSFMGLRLFDVALYVYFDSYYGVF